MNKKVLIITAWLIGGFIVGWYSLINVQLYLSVKEVARVNKTQETHIADIEKVLQQAFGEQATSTPNDLKK